MDKLFVIAIGGTGMRCLESFVHLCAIGMFDGEEIEILTLDTDQSNGNKGRVEELVDLYQRIKSNDPQKIDGGQPNVNTFFSAKLNIHKFYTNYTTETRKTYKLISSIEKASEVQQKDNEDLASLFLDPDTVQSFDLSHGYRAQTHLGSMLMYHGIVEAAINFNKNKDGAAAQEKALMDFVTQLAQAGENARVFIFGSVFGGTGASSIPVIPVALRDAAAFGSDGTITLDLNKVKFGSTLLTEYFSFPAPDSKKKKAEHIVADSNIFALNSQAALQFYQGDPTVMSIYKRLYHIGWPLKSQNLSEGGSTETITGGQNQKNKCHVAELMCACAAYDFFTLPDEEFGDATKPASYLFRTVPFEGNNFSFEKGSDFVGSSKGEVFMNKLGAMFSFAHIVLAKQQAAKGSAGVKGLISRFDEQKIHDYDSLNDIQAKEIDDYFREYFGYVMENGRFKPGWIMQIRNSIGSGQFIFKPDAFPDATNFNSVDPGDIFLDKKHQWDKGMLSNRYDDFIKKAVEKEDAKPNSSQKVNTVKERFLAHLYNSITISQKFNLK